MEEQLGLIWNKVLTKGHETDSIKYGVRLQDITTDLQIYYRAMGGCRGKSIEASSYKNLPVKKNVLDRLSGRKQALPAWHDQRSLKLPYEISVFQDRKLNEDLYFWLVALGANLPVINNWSSDNQTVTSCILEKRPGLAKNYYEIAESYCNYRRAYYRNRYHETEFQIQEALLNPKKNIFLSADTEKVLPILLWLYPMPNQGKFSLQESDIPDDSKSAESNKSQFLRLPRKKTKIVDQEKETDGLLVFKLESLFSWTEQVNVDRPEEEDLDDSAAAAEDLDIITLARNKRNASGKYRFDLDLPSAANDDLQLGPGIKLPEWDFKKQMLRKNYCLVQPMLADEPETKQIPLELKHLMYKVRRYFTKLRPEKKWTNRHFQGEELDINSWIQYQTEPSKSEETPRCFIHREETFRDLSCLLLADTSMSTDCAIDEETRVIDVIRHSLLVFCEALSHTNDQLGIYGFSSVRNKNVRYHLLKNFDEPYSDSVLGRILAIKPGFYTRMGAAIRQSISILDLQKTRQKLLLIISDGKPNDLDQYEGRYGIEDTRQAFLEAKKKGINPFCITIDTDGNEYLPYIFGRSGYCILSSPTELPSSLPKIYLNLTAGN